MTLDQIIALVVPGESETLECKTSTGTRREAVRTVCAMLNQRGGTVLFGVAPDGNVLGQHVSERTIEEVGAEIRRIEPPAFLAVERVQVEDDRAVIVVSVHQGPTQLYTYRGTAYRRVGNTTVALSTDEYGRMLFERMHSDRALGESAGNRLAGRRPRRGRDSSHGCRGGSARPISSTSAQREWACRAASGSGRAAGPHRGRIGARRDSHAVGFRGQRSSIAASAGRVERHRNDRLRRLRTGSALETSETGLMYDLGPTLRRQGAL